MALDKNQVKKILNDNGYKFTDPRKEIYKLFNTTKSHFTIQEAIKELNKNSHIGTATIYRNILIFNKLGILDKVVLKDNVVRYEIKNIVRDHNHMICTRCGKIIETKRTEIKGLMDLAKKEDFTVEDYELNFYGICKKCKEAESNWYLLCSTNFLKLDYSVLEAAMQCCLFLSANLLRRAS